METTLTLAPGLLGDSILAHNFLAWLFFAMAFAGIGMGIARFICDEDQRRAAGMERDNERLRLERNELERKLKTGRDL